MLLILDSNEYIFALSALGDKTSEKLLNKILGSHNDISVRIPRLIVNEVRHNLTPIDEDTEMPFEADAFIAVYAEWISADILVTENRHFLSRQDNLPSNPDVLNDSVDFWRLVSSCFNASREAATFLASGVSNTGVGFSVVVSFANALGVSRWLAVGLDTASTIGIAGPRTACALEP